MYQKQQREKRNRHANTITNNRSYHLLRVSRDIVLGRGVAHPATPGRCLSLSLCYSALAGSGKAHSRPGGSNRIFIP